MKDSNQGDINIRKIEEIFNEISTKIDFSKEFPKKITEQLCFICSTVIEGAKLKNIYFYNLSINLKGKWYELKQEILLDFLIDVGVEFGTEEYKLNTARNRNALLKQFNILSRSSSNKLIMKGKIQSPKSKEKKPIKLQYPIICIGKSTYQEKSPGILKEWSNQHATNKYGKEVVSLFEHYIGFTCVPSHINYQRVIGDEYNKYKKISHKEIEGDYDNIKALLTHIFGEGDGFKMGMEYMWNLYMNPTQEMPFLGLVSESKGTGKSTFLKLLRFIFEENVSVVSAVDFKNPFNDHYVSSLILTSDEHAEGNDRKIVAQRMKMYITEPYIRAEAKFATAYTTKKYFKIVFAGNDEEMMTFIEDENTRYWIIRVPKLEKTIDGFDKLLKKEIPAFLYFLRKAFVAKPSRGRLYFDPKEFQTEAGKKIQKNSTSTMKRKIEEHLSDLFETYDIDEICYTPKTLAEDMKEQKKEVSYIRDVLKKDMKLTPKKESYYFPIGCREQQKECEDKEGVSNFKQFVNKTNGRYFIFKRKDFIENIYQSKSISEEGIEVIKRGYNSASNGMLF